MSWEYFLWEISADAFVKPWLWQVDGVLRLCQQPRDVWLHALPPEVGVALFGGTVARKVGEVHDPTLAIGEIHWHVVFGLLTFLLQSLS